MKKILGLDLGTNSIGWAVVNEAEHADEQSSIVKIGVRVNPLTVDELSNFEKGKSITTNADRTLKRGMRRNLQRYKLRREHLLALLKEKGFISEETILSESGNRTTFETYRLRAKAATEEISLEEFARVLLMINKKRGYKSNRKAKNTEEGQLINGMEIAKRLYQENLTPGQLCWQLLQDGKKSLPDFYGSDLQSEFDKVFEFQRQYYSFLTDELKKELSGKNDKAVWAICAPSKEKEPSDEKFVWKWVETVTEWDEETSANQTVEKVKTLEGLKREGNTAERKRENYEWRSRALEEQLSPEQLIVVFQEINKQINNASGYLGNISDRSKELYFTKQTVGQWKMKKLDEDPNHSLKNKVFYRQDYLDEFEKIWETQAKYHSELTPELKKEVRDIVIFYQRPLKSQKGLISICELEGKQMEIEKEGKNKLVTIGPKVCPKSSPLFQEFKIWQRLNDVQVVNAEGERRFLNQNEKNVLFEELNYREKLSKTETLKLLFDKKHKEYDLNFEGLDGNRTQSELFKTYQKIIEMTGHGEYDFSKMSAKAKVELVTEIFEGLGFNTGILTFDSSIKDKKEFEQQPFYQLWHLLYSFEGDKSVLGNEKLIEKISEMYGFDKESATVLAGVIFQPDYGSISAKAIRKILPDMMRGDNYSTACEKAGYNHSKRSLTKEELEKKVWKDKLDLLPRNSLRNPVVEKILNQMINVVNAVVDAYGKPDEIRIELARELKKSAKERDELTKAINNTKKQHDVYTKKLQEEFGLTHVSRNDIIRYKLYEELRSNGYRTLYSNTYIPREELFSKKFDIEHIIPQAKLFDDSFSNKTIEARDVNIKKSNMTAWDYVVLTNNEGYANNEYKNRVEKLFADKIISKSKRDKLLMREVDIPSDFINRDLRDSQYIAKKAREILEGMVKFVVPTTGSITDRLREDWQLVDVMRELNWDKYDRLGMTYYEQDRDGRQIPKIKDWTKRNDHRHHAMDALTIAFTKRSFIQYLNNLNARVQKGVDEWIDLDTVELSKLDKEQRTSVVYAIEKKELYRDSHGKLRFNPPNLTNNRDIEQQLSQFRREARRQLENVLVSIKAKNKVVTRNVNKAKNKSGEYKIQLTPRGQLHLEKVFGSQNRYVTKEEKVNASFDAEKIKTVAVKRYREALVARLAQYGGDAKKAFTGKNTLDKNPVWVNAQQSEKVPEKVKTVEFEKIYTIREEVTPDLKIDKVVDAHIKKILQNRLAEYGGDAKKAFSNLEENPIWLNKERGISIKRVTIERMGNYIALHDKRDKNGNLTLDENGKKLPVDFVSTGNNHHVAIYRKPVLDKNGLPVLNENNEVEYELDEKIVSFYEATSRAMLGLPVVDKEYRKSEGWQFLFTMKQNEYFVFPRYESYIDSEGKEAQRMIFNPMEHDEAWYKNPENYALISPNLFRVQKFSYKNYVFRHHLETTIDLSEYNLRGTTWVDFRSSKGLDKILKVRVNHIGQIVSVGEY